MSDQIKPYEPAVIYYPDSDVAEYVTRDTAVMYDEISPQVALVRDLQTREILGFRIQDPARWGAFVSAQ
jgi:hypothetical protein